MKLNNIRLLVANFDETFLFYRDKLGLKVTWGDLGENYAQFQLGNAETLAIFSKNLMAKAVNTSHLPSKSSAQDNMALIFTVENVDQFYDSLHSKGISFIDKPSDQPDWGIRVVHLRDPEGNLLEFITDLKKEKLSKDLANDFNKYSKD